jgi:hypothetical protein
MLKSFGNPESYSLQKRFPVDNFIHEAMTDMQLLISKDYFDGNAIEFHVMAIFDHFQRRHLDNMFHTHPEMRVFRQSAKTASLAPPDSTPSKPQLVLENDTGVTDLSTIRLSLSKNPLVSRASSPNSQISDVSASDISGSDSSNRSHLNRAQSQWKVHARHYANDKLLSAVSNLAFDLEGFNKTFDKMVLSSSEPIPSDKLEALVGRIFDHYLRKCTPRPSPDELSVSSASVVSVHPTTAGTTRQVFDLTRDSGATAPSVLISGLPDTDLVRPFGQSMSLGVDNLTSVRFNPLNEHKRFEGMLKSLGKKEILEVLSLFDTYELNGGVYPLYMWIITKTLKVAFYGVLPPIEKLRDNTFVRNQLELWVAPQNLAQLKEEFKEKVAMPAKFSSTSIFKEQSYIRYKGDMMLFWCDNEKYVGMTPTNFSISNAPGSWTVPNPMYFEKSLKFWRKMLIHLKV